jgi:hypothetical protein
MGVKNCKLLVSTLLLYTCFAGIITVDDTLSYELDSKAGSLWQSLSSSVNNKLWTAASEPYSQLLSLLTREGGSEYL